MSMEENALQFVNNTGLQNLHAFVLNLSNINLQLLIHTPALYAIAEFELNGKQAGIETTTLAVFRWIYIRAFVVLHQLTAQGIVPSGNIPAQADDWQKVFMFHLSRLYYFTVLLRQEC